MQGLLLFGQLFVKLETEGALLEGTEVASKANGFECAVVLRYSLIDMTAVLPQICCTIIGDTLHVGTVLVSCCNSNRCHA